ncbi:MAG: hypothetical protein PW788_05375 [Micavibrio sp.]|nr:hypothetical protein [Micavibrio sp.]
MAKPLTFGALKQAIIDSLSPDLLEKKYAEQLTPDDPPETGHCAVASEAFYHLAGGKRAGFMPVVCGYAADGAGNMAFGADKLAALASGWRRETHWWIRGAKNGQRGAGEIFDVTSGQYPAAYPYHNGHNTGFMQPQQKPSRRAQVIIDRVTEVLGAARLAQYRDANIRAFKRAAMQQSGKQKKPAFHGLKP